MAVKRNIYEYCKCGEKMATLLPDGSVKRKGSMDCKCPKIPGPLDPPRTYRPNQVIFVPGMYARGKPMTEQLYVYYWGNDKTTVGKFRMQFNGRKCRVLARGKMNSCLIEFVDNGQHLTTSRNALRKVQP